MYSLKKGVFDGNEKAHFNVNDKTIPNAKKSPLAYQLYTFGKRNRKMLSFIPKNFRTYGKKILSGNKGVNSQSPEFLKYEDLFLTDRNKNWIPKLKENLSERSCFIAVGAAHLFGESGLISLLEFEGYTVTPLKK